MFDEAEVEIDNKVDELSKIIDKKYKKIYLTFNKQSNRKSKAFVKKNILQFITVF
jgi:hypothetical protein